MAFLCFFRNISPNLKDHYYYTFCSKGCKQKRHLLISGKNLLEEEMRSENWYGVHVRFCLCDNRVFNFRKCTINNEKFDFTNS